MAKRTLPTWTCPRPWGCPLPIPTTTREPTAPPWRLAPTPTPPAATATTTSSLPPAPGLAPAPTAPPLPSPPNTCIRPPRPSRPRPRTSRAVPMRLPLRFIPPGRLLRRRRRHRLRGDPIPGGSGFLLRTAICRNRVAGGTFPMRRLEMWCWNLATVISMLAVPLPLPVVLPVVPLPVVLLEVWKPPESNPSSFGPSRRRTNILLGRSE
mmetsp:Transcript_9036/g.18868  ORF Transcript_9036/g.18868 Transcript_9036/m.18868 type:complete len:209 (-) Transcript_9036:155-781(-)